MRLKCMNTQVDINVYPNKLDLSLFEPCKGNAGETLHQWLVSNVPDYVESDTPLFSAFINSREVHPSEFKTTTLNRGDDVKLIVEAKGAAAIAYAIIAVVAVGVAIYATNQIPDNYNSTTPDGSSIYDVNTQGNKPKLMGVIPENAGHHKVYPDYLTMPRKEYINNEQWLYLMLCVGKGSYELLDENILIANTPVSRYVGDIDYQVFGPGEDVSGHEAHRNVFTSSEVGSTSGSAGIELKGKTTNTGGENGRYIYSFKDDKIIVHYEEFDAELNRPIRFKVTPPFELDEILSISNTFEGQNDGDYRLITKHSLGSLVQKVTSSGSSDSTWLEFIEETNSTAIVSVEYLGGDGEFSGPFFACPAGEKTNKIWLDFKLPQGLGELDDDGNILNKVVEVWIEYRNENTSVWTSMIHIFSNSTNDELGETIPINLPSKMRPEVRVKRFTAATDDTRIFDDVFWTGLKAELASATSYSGATTIAVKIRGTNALAGSAENKFNVIPTRILPVYENGVWSEPKPTNDIAPFFAHVIQSAGHSQDKIGLDELEALHTIWHNRGDEFNAVFDTGSTLFAVLKRVLAPGFAKPVLDYGKILPVRDQPRTIHKHMYQPDNYIGLLERDIKLIDDDEHDGIEVEYFSPVTWKSETVLCLLPGDLGVNPDKIRAFGITNRDKAYQYGMRERRTRRYRRTTFNFTTETDALNSGYLDYCALADDIPGYEQSGVVEYIIGNSVYVNTELKWQSGQSHVFALRKPDGTLSGPYTATIGSASNEVIINEALDFEPVFDGSIEPPLFMFGIASRWCNNVLITDIKPSSTDRVKVTAERYDERVYLDDDSLAPT